MNLDRLDNPEPTAAIPIESLRHLLGLVRQLPPSQLRTSLFESVGHLLLRGIEDNGNQEVRQAIDEARTIAEQRRAAILETAREEFRLELAKLQSTRGGTRRAQDGAA